MSPSEKARQNRDRKIECDSCGCILRGSASALRLNGLPLCRCGGSFDVPNLADLEHIDPERFEERLNMLRAGERNALYRQLGYDHAVQSPNRRGSAQCSKGGCKQLRAPLERFCRDHVEVPVPF